MTKHNICNLFLILISVGLLLEIIVIGSYNMQTTNNNHQHLG